MSGETLICPVIPRFFLVVIEHTAHHLMIENDPPCLVEALWDARRVAAYFPQRFLISFPSAIRFLLISFLFISFLFISFLPAIRFLFSSLPLSSALQRLHRLRLHRLRLLLAVRQHRQLPSLNIGDPFSVRTFIEIVSTGALAVRSGPFITDRCVFVINRFGRWSRHSCHRCCIGT